LNRGKRSESEMSKEQKERTSHHLVLILSFHSLASFIEEVDSDSRHEDENENEDENEEFPPQNELDTRQEMLSP